MRPDTDDGLTSMQFRNDFMQRRTKVSEEVKDLLQNALEALDQILDMDEDKVSGDLWDEVNDAYHRIENIID